MKTITKTTKQLVEKSTQPDVVKKLKKFYQNNTSETFTSAVGTIREYKEKLPAQQRFNNDLSAQIAYSIERGKHRKEPIYINGELAKVVVKIYKNIEHILRRFRIAYTTEDYCYWVRAEKVDKVAMRFDSKSIDPIVSTVDIWIYYEDGEISVGIEDDYLFTALPEEYEEIPLFLGAYFKSKFGKGKIVVKNYSEQN